MPLTKLCARCGAVIPIGQRYCTACQAKSQNNARQYDRRIRDKRSAAFYKSAEWMRIRDFCLHRDGYMCQECRKKGVVTAATEVHHIVPLRHDWSMRADASNLVSLCHKHHMEVERKTRRGM